MSVLIERLAEHGSAPLEGYGHQVGGHFLLMKYEDAAICKPLIKREHFFYETLPDDLKLFLPAYYGAIKVAFEQLSSGEIQMVAYPKNHGTSSSSQTTKIEHYSLKASTGKSIHVGESSITSKGVAGGDSYVNPWSKECTKNTTRKLKQFGSQLEDLHQDYMVLENLTSKFSSPSILDLKIGTRQHGDDVSEVKRKKHMKTVAESTSGTIGVRICGMQKFDASKNEYIFRDKYYGRSLDEEGFYQELRAFLHNGVCFRSDLVPSLLSMVQDLRTIIKRQCSYRFYSSSLLIIYDGAAVPDPTEIGRELKPSSVALTDVSLNGENTSSCFELTNGQIEGERRESESSTLLDPQSSAVSGEKEGSMLPREESAAFNTHEVLDLMHVNPTAPFRLQHFLDDDLPPHHTREGSSHNHTCLSSATTNVGSVSGTMTGLPEESSNLPCDGTVAQEPLLSATDRDDIMEPVVSDTNMSSSNHKIKNGYHHKHRHEQHCCPRHKSTPPYVASIDLEQARKSVDLRMIDFAHSTHRGYNDTVQYEGPDNGYVLGVSSLVRCFERMLRSPHND